MKILVEISRDSYRNLLAQYDCESADYASLSEAFFKLNGWRTVSLCCEESQAASLLAAAERSDPKAAVEIARCIALAREL